MTLRSSARGVLKQELDAGRDAVAWAKRTKRGIVEYLEDRCEDKNTIHADLDRARWWPVVEETKEGQK